MSDGTEKKRAKAAIIILAFLIIANAAFILSNSIKTAAESSVHSKELTRLIASIFTPGFDEMSAREQSKVVAALNKPIRQCAHVVEFGILGMLSMLFLQAMPSTKAKQRRIKLLYTLSFCVLFAFVDESFQLFVDGRAFQLQDIAFDTAGSLIGASMVILILIYKK